MKTGDLVALLEKDAKPVPQRALSIRLAVASIVAVGLASVILALWLGIRPDLQEAFANASFWMKAAYTSGLAVAGFALVERLGRPGARDGFGLVVLLVVLVVMAALAALQLMRTPVGDRAVVLMGSTSMMCPWRIVGLAAPGLAVLIAAMRVAAPSRPALAGAAAGLLAGGLAATVYGFYCQETAAAFVAVWYSLGIGLSGLIGALFGARLLRW